MIQRIYVHNFRCLENFTLDLKNTPTTLLIGANGAGKSTVGRVLEVLQTVARGENRVGRLVTRSDFTRGREDVPMRFVVEALLGGVTYEYQLALELPPRFHELRVLEERLSAAGEEVFARTSAQVALQRPASSRAQFRVDWHLVALPIIQEESAADPLSVFRTWLARMFIVSPVPSRMTGASSGETLFLDKDCLNFASVFAGLLAAFPAAYGRVESHLRAVMPEFLDVKNPLVGRDARQIVVRFRTEDGGTEFSPSFEQLSDGEKCFFVGAVVLAANEAYGPLLTFWDEPDNHLAMTEVGHFVHALRRAFKAGGQLIATSHHAETIRRFSDESTILLLRRSRFEPTEARRLAEVGYSGDLVSSLLRGDLGA
ncbi:MAG: AAA family ATPase [Planctomycetes bacterium]|nr:AAA family ATPase [Planctomycetota bacterium]